MVKGSGSEIQGEGLGEVASHAPHGGLEPVDDRELEKGLNRGGTESHLNGSLQTGLSQ